MTATIRIRRPAIAALLSFLTMGLGQLYNGQFRRAVVFFAVEIIGIGSYISFPSLLFSSHGIALMYFWVAMYVACRIYSIVDAYSAARRIGELQLQPYNRWYVYLLIMIVLSSISLPFDNSAKAYHIPAGSMMPNLLVGDYLYADESAYDERAPERGDIVIFQLLRDDKIDYIKRLIGLPGDRIQVRDEVLYINDEAVERRQIEDIEVVERFGSVQVRRYVETLPNGVGYEVIEQNHDRPLDNTEVYAVPDGHYFFMGDNRDGSLDSRVLGHVGFVPAENLLSRAEVVFFSTDGSAEWWQVWRWPIATRFARIGKQL